MENNKKAVIVGATSGIGYAVALELINKGWILGIAGRRVDKLKELQALAPNQIKYREIDVQSNSSCAELNKLIADLGGIDLYLHCSGIGKQNYSLKSEIELNTVATNVDGFVRMVTCAFNYFAAKGNGHIAVISSIAGTKGLGAAAAYSASKRFQNTYIDCLDQLCHIRKFNIDFTDIRPGFVATPLLDGGGKYPMVMDVSKVARRIVTALNKKERVTVIDWRYRILVFFWRLIPLWLWRRLPICN